MKGNAFVVPVLAAAFLAAMVMLGQDPPRHPEEVRQLRYVGLQNAVSSRLDEVVAEILEEGLHPDPPPGPHASELLERFYARIPPALQTASRTGQPEIVQLLLEAGARPDLQSSSGETALYLAARGGHQDVVELLLGAGADPELSGPDGSPAEVAAENGHDSVSRMLRDAASVSLETPRSPAPDIGAPSPSPLAGYDADL